MRWPHKGAMLEGCQPLKLDPANLSFPLEKDICLGLFLLIWALLACEWPIHSHSLTSREARQKCGSHLWPSLGLGPSPGFSCLSAEPSSTRGQLVKRVWWACLAQDETGTNLMLIIMVVISSLIRRNPLQPSPMALYLGNASHNKSKGSVLS